MKKLPFLSILSAGLLISPIVSYAEEAMTLPVKRLTVDTALKIAKATLTQCRKEGMNVAVTVIDRGGDAQVVLRDTLAMDVTLDISMKKAYTAMSFNTRTDELQDRAKTIGPLATYDGLLLQGGGVPINIGGTIMGGIGVSGSPSSKIDQKCANAGLEAVQADLELSL
jgi:uncharacterized protein GlcG (DUF336 family)